MTDRSTRYVFMHVPKTAGMSLRALLGEIFTPNEISLARGVRPIGPDEARELDTYRVISEHISAHDVAAYFSDRNLFTFLRNPLERCLSIYGYFRQLTHFPLIPLDQIQGANNAEEATSLARQLDPDDFFRSAHPHLAQNLHDRAVWQLGYRAAIEHRRDIAPAEAYDRARRNLHGYLFIGFFETLPADAARLRQVLGAPADQHELPWANRTSVPLRWDDLGVTARRAIERCTEWDRRLYDFAWELVRRRSAA
jgi:hypothetical protein